LSALGSDPNRRIVFRHVLHPQAQRMSDVVVAEKVE
jgi:hypothetical protein